MSSIPQSPNRKIVIPKGTLNPNETTVLKICNSVPKNQNISTAGDRRQNRSLPENFKPTDAQGFKPPNFLTRKEGSPIISRCPASRPDFSSSMVDSSLEDDSMPALFGNQGGGVINRDQKDMYNRIVIPVKTPWEPVQQYRYGERQGFAPCSCSSLVEGKNLQMEKANDISAVQESTFDESDFSQSYPTGSFPGEQSYNGDSGNDAFYSAQSQLSYITCPSSTPRKENLTIDRRNNDATFNSSILSPPSPQIQANTTFERRCSDSVNVPDSRAANATFDTQPALNRTMNVASDVTFDSSKKRSPSPLANSTFNAGTPNQTFNISNRTNEPSPLRDGSANKLANATFNTQAALNRTMNAADATFDASKKRGPCPLANSTFNAGAPNQTFNVSNGSDNILSNATFNTQAALNRTMNAADATFDASKRRGPCPLANSTFNAGAPSQTFNVSNGAANKLANATFNAGPPPRNSNQTFNASNGSANKLANTTFNAGPPPRKSNQTFNMSNVSANQAANATFNVGPPAGNSNRTFNMSNGSANQAANATFNVGPPAGNSNRTFNMSNGSANQVANATFNAGSPARNPNQTFNMSNRSANQAANITFNNGPSPRNPNQTFNISNGTNGAVPRPCPLSNMNRTFNAANSTFTTEAANATFDMTPINNGGNGGFADQTFIKPRRPCPLKDQNKAMANSGNQGRNDSRNRNSRNGSGNAPCPANKPRNVSFQ